MIVSRFLVATVGLFLLSCTAQPGPDMKSSDAEAPIRLMVLDPGHFHAGLIQKTMYPQVSPLVHVYAPGGPELEDHLHRVGAYNTRPENPTRWEQTVYTGPDYLERMLEDKPGNLVVTAGNNRRKTEYIRKSVEAGIHVLADKPMCIDQTGWEALKNAFQAAQKNGVLLYDIMTERYEITSILQKELVHKPEVFGELKKGTPDDPSVIKESVHHLFKYVSGAPLKRPAWFFDVTQQGEGIVDVTTHLVDLVMWGCFPGQPIDYATDIEVLRARRWPTLVSREQFEKVTGSVDFPDYLKKDVNQDGLLADYCNGEIVYQLKGVHAKVSVIWNYQAPEGGGDTHFSVIRGTKAEVVIRQGKEQNYRPELYVEPVAGTSREGFGEALKKAVAELQAAYPGIELQAEKSGWRVLIPDTYRVGHEAHFAQVAEQYLRFLGEGKLPDWEVPNMIAKYYTTTRALQLARE